MIKIESAKELAEAYVDSIRILYDQPLSAESRLKACSAIEEATTVIALLNIARSLENISDYCAAKINEVKNDE